MPTPHPPAAARPIPLTGPLPGPAVFDEAASEALDFLARRYSVGPKHLAQPAPDAAALTHAVALALRAPDHRRLRPLRFVQVSDASRPRLAALFAADAAQRGHSATEVERARDRAYNGPALLAVVARLDKHDAEVPPHEQWITVGAGVMNFLNGLHLQGYAAKLLSGASVRSPDIAQSLCARNEHLVAWIVAGTPTQAAQPKGQDEPGMYLSVW